MKQLNEDINMLKNDFSNRFNETIQEKENIWTETSLHSTQIQILKEAFISLSDTVSDEIMSIWWEIESSIKIPFEKSFELLTQSVCDTDKEVSIL